MKNKQQIETIITSRKCRSAWVRAVKAYALELIESLEGEVITKREFPERVKAVFLKPGKDKDGPFVTLWAAVQS
jgi:predicted glycosyltransferase